MMMTMKTMRSVVVALTLLVPAAAMAATTPMATLKAKNGEVDKLLHNKVEKGTPAETKQKAAIKEMAASLIDYDELAKKALVEQWDKLTTAQRTEFVSTFRELIERNYVKQLRSNMDYQVQYKGEQMDEGGGASVTTIVKVKSAGKSTDAEIVYKMHKVGDEWRVWDVITDEVSLARNYKTQFHKIIAEQGYDALMKKMKNKLAEESSN